MTLKNSKIYKKLKDAGLRQGWWLDRAKADPAARSGLPGILVALSGGGDSMALLTLLLEFYGGRVEAAHLEHGFRGEASLSDAAFVEEYCEKIGVACHVKNGNVMGNCLRGESPEAAGRRMRYEFMSEVAGNGDISFIATGHNSGDAVETALFNLFRGTGIAGLSGIPEVSYLPFAPGIPIVRPVIGFSGAELRSFLAENGVPWREDATNSENSYRRNMIRNELLPWVRSNLNPQADEAILGLVRECGSISDSLERDAAETLRYLAVSNPAALGALAVWSISSARKLSEEKLPYAIRTQGKALSLPVLDRARTLELCGLIARSGRWRFQWAGDVEVCASGGLIGWVNRGELESWILRTRRKIKKD